MNRIFALVGLLAATLVPHTQAEAKASYCSTYGPAPGGMGRYFSAVCGGSGGFYVVARCYNDDWVLKSYAYGSWAYAPYGVSEGYCPFGTHPWSRWVVSL